jgi:DNA-binding CsgD family transcriptional regulator/tetratricopeptide (TPR) repeat protein
MAQLAWEEADSWYARALAASSGPQFVSQDRCRLLLAGAQAQVKAYNVDDARRSLLAAADIAREAGDAATIAHAALTMEGVTDFQWEPTGRALCLEALGGIGDQDSALRARLLAMLAVADSWHSPTDAQRRSEQALSMAERVGDRRAIVAALRARQMARSGPDGAVDRLALAERMLAIGDDDTVLWGRLWRFDAFAQLGDIDRAEAELSAISAVAERLRSPLARWHAVRYQATIAQARGRFPDALALARQAETLARRAGRVPSLGFLLLLSIQLGEVDPAPDEVLQAQFDAAPTAALRAIYAGWKLATGQREEAHRMYLALPPLDDLPAFMMLPTLAAAVELAAEFGDRETAAKVHRLLSPHADLINCGGAGVVMIGGSVRFALGIAAAALGRLDDAIRQLRAAVQINERAGLPPSTASARYHLARTLARRRRPGDQDEAAAQAASAAALAGQLGMAPLQRSALVLAESLCGHKAGPLTAREQQVAVMVSQGLTNRQIAAAAHISERTAENHVQHILTKLGFTGRVQIAIWAAAGASSQPPSEGSGSR